MMTVLTAYAAFLLVRRVTGGTFESWLAGAWFAWSPFMVTRGTAHFGLVAAAPLPIFLLLLLGAAPSTPAGCSRARHLSVVGRKHGCLYAVDCIIMAAAYFLSQTISLHRRPEPERAWGWALDVVTLSLEGLALAILISRGFRVTFLGQRFRPDSLHTPVLLLTTCLGIRAAWGGA